MVTRDFSIFIVFGIFRQDFVIDVIAGTDTDVVCSIVRIIKDDKLAGCTVGPFADGILCFGGPIDVSAEMKCQSSELVIVAEVVLISHCRVIAVVVDTDMF